MQRRCLARATNRKLEKVPHGHTSMFTLKVPNGNDDSHGVDGRVGWKKTRSREDAVDNRTRSSKGVQYEFSMMRKSPGRCAHKPSEAPSQSSAITE